MKLFLSTFAMAFALLASGGTVADDAKPLALEAAQLEQINAGWAFAISSSSAGAAGSFFSSTSTSTTTATVSILGPIPAAGSYSEAFATSAAE